MFPGVGHVVAARGGGSIRVAIDKVSDGCHLRQIINLTAISAVDWAGHVLPGLIPISSKLIGVEVPLVKHDYSLILPSTALDILPMLSAGTMEPKRPLVYQPRDCSMGSDTYRNRQSERWVSPFSDRRSRHNNDSKLGIFYPVCSSGSKLAFVCNRSERHPQAVARCQSRYN